MPLRLVTIFLLLLSCSPLFAEERNDKDIDPWRPFNEKMQAFNDHLDNFLIKPAAKGYRFIVPKPLSKGISNLFSNLGEPINLVNNLLQGKPKDSLVDLGRFTVNSTFGVLGLFDVATRLEWHQNNEDFGQTLAVWGVPSGPFLVLPFFTQTSVRDGLARVPESFTNLNPIYWGDPHIDLVIGSIGLDVVDGRADLLETEKILFGNRYQALRDFYLQQRDFYIKDGNIEDDFMSDDDDW